MTFDDIYEDDVLVQWTENISRETLELEFLQLVARYRQKTREIQQLKKEASDRSWERTMRRQERSGGWMQIMKYAVRVGGEYFCDGPMDNLRVVVMKREQAENLAKILLASGDEQDIEVVEYD